jgi:hypothetical protein
VEPEVTHRVLELVPSDPTLSHLSVVGIFTPFLLLRYILIVSSEESSFYRLYMEVGFILRDIKFDVHL